MHIMNVYICILSEKYLKAGPLKSRRRVTVSRPERVSGTSSNVQDFSQTGGMSEDLREGVKCSFCLKHFRHIKSAVLHMRKNHHIYLGNRNFMLGELHQVPTLRKCQHIVCCCWTARGCFIMLNILKGFSNKRHHEFSKEIFTTEFYLNLFNFQMITQARGFFML